MSGMQSLYVGLSGIQSNSNALNTTAHNIANVNTEGYVRQQVVYKDTAYNNVATTSAINTGQRGQGVGILEIAHVRDMFLDAQYRKESGRQAFYENMYDSVYEIETHLGELDGVAYQDTLTGLLNSLNELTATPTDQTAVSGLVQAATAFIDRSKSIYNGLLDYQNTLNQNVIDITDRINQIGQRIVELNERITKIEAGNIENANGLRDERDLLIDELSTYGKINVKEYANKSVYISFENIPLVDDTEFYQMGLETIPGTDLVEPVWPALGNQAVYNLNVEICTEDNTDVGGLKGLLAARGSVTPTFETLTEPDPDDYVTTTYTDGTQNPEYIKAQAAYERYLTSEKSSPLVVAMANFDKLVNSVVTQINDILCPEKTVTVGGQEYTVLDTDKASMAADGTYGVELFTRNYCDRYVATTLSDGNTYYVRNDISTFGNASAYTVTNVTVNSEILQDFSKMPLHTAEGEEDYDKAKAMVALFDQDLLQYNDGNDSLTFEEFYEQMTLDMADRGSIYKSMADNETTLANALDSERQEVMSVSSDEELSNMIRYQQAYGASSRYINVITEMLDSLIAMVG